MFKITFKHSLNIKERSPTEAAALFSSIMNMNHLEYVTCGTCSRLITIDVDDEGVIRNLSFVGGCNGNLKGICALSIGKKAADVKQALKGITCGAKPTSCPDQLATALEQMGY